jgi:hypothetical protein
MANYWCAFRLAADRAYRARYEAFLKAMFALRGRTGAAWSEAGYFLAFQAEAGLEEVGRALRTAIDPERDLVVVGVVGTGEAIVIGALRHPDAFAAIFPSGRPLD